MLRRMFSRGIYEFLSYLLPGAVTLYLLYVLFLVAGNGPGAFDSILLTMPAPIQNGGFSILFLLLIAYLFGHLSWPLRLFSRRVCYGGPSNQDRIYSSLKKYFPDEVDGRPLYDHVIDDLEEFTDIRGIPRIPHTKVDEKLEFKDICDTPGGTHCNFVTIRSDASMIPDGTLPVMEITVDSDGKKMRRAYRLVKRFIEFTYPNLYHRGYERYQGLRRFWEVMFAIGIIFGVVAFYVVMASEHVLLGGLVFVVALSVTLASVKRLTKLVLNPYREVFILFYLHMSGELPHQ